MSGGFTGVERKQGRRGGLMDIVTFEIELRDEAELSPPRPSPAGSSWERVLMDVAVGTPVPAWVIESVNPEKMKIFAALARDPNPIHWDRAAVAERGLGDRLINQGPTNLGYVVNMLLAWTGPASLRDIAVRFTSNVFDGDTVTAGGVVHGVRVEGKASVSPTATSGSTVATGRGRSRAPPPSLLPG